VPVLRPVTNTISLLGLHAVGTLALFLRWFWTKSNYAMLSSIQLNMVCKCIFVCVAALHLAPGNCVTDSLLYFLLLYLLLKPLLFEFREFNMRRPSQIL
jgi:hypothetical protein